MPEALPGPGDNRPSLRELLAEDAAEVERRLDAEGADLKERVALLLRAYVRVPDVVDNNHLARDVTDQAAQFAAALKSGEQRRVADKTPALAIERGIDRWYRRVLEPLAGAKKDLEARLNDWQKQAGEARVRGERGAVATMRHDWTCDGLVRAEVDLEALRHHFTDDAIYAAVRRYIAEGGRSLKGVRIHRNERTQIIAP